MQRLSTQRIARLPPEVSKIVGAYATKEPDRWQRGATRDCATWQETYRWKEDAFFAKSKEELVVTRQNTLLRSWGRPERMAVRWWVCDLDDAYENSRQIWDLGSVRQSLLRDRDLARLENARAEYLQARV